MCDLAWVMVSEQVRAVALADRPAYLSAGEDPPNPAEHVERLRAAICAPPERVGSTPEMQALRALLGV